jgi:hypothetical protein
MIDLLHAYRISKRREIVDTHSHAVAVVMGIALRVSRQPTTSPSVQFTSPHVFFLFFHDFLRCSSRRVRWVDVSSGGDEAYGLSHIL